MPGVFATTGIELRDYRAFRLVLTVMQTWMATTSKTSTQTLIAASMEM